MGLVTTIGSNQPITLEDLHLALTNESSKLDLDLSDNNWGDEQIKALSILLVNDHRITKKGATYLAAALRVNKVLGYHFQLSEAKNICEEILNEDIIPLDVSENHIDAEGIFLLQKTFKETGRSLHYLKTENQSSIEDV